MDFELNEQQRLLKDSVDRLIERRYGFEQRAQYLRLPGGWSRELWAQMAQMGLPALPFAEADGGFGAGPEELMVVMEALGRGLVLEPFLACAVLAGGILREASRPAQRARLLPALIDGTEVLSWAHWEPQSRWERANIVSRAQPEGDGWRLSGRKSLVLHGDGADRLVVTARVGGGDRDESGLGLFLVDPASAGVSRKGYALQDGTRAAEVHLDGVLVPATDVLGEPGAAFPIIDRVLDEATAAICAECVGAMARMHEVTMDYLRTREQFGKTIGSFQALQHRAVDMLIHLEQARSMTFYAVSALTGVDAGERRRAIHAAKAQVGRSARFIGQQAIQLHGAVGMTLEYLVGHYVKRTTVLDLLFGDAHHHQSALARLGGLFAVEAD